MICILWSKLELCRYERHITGIHFWASIPIYLWKFSKQPLTLWCPDNQLDDLKVNILVSSVLTTETIRRSVNTIAEPTNFDCYNRSRIIDQNIVLLNVAKNSKGNLSFSSNPSYRSLRTSSSLNSSLKWNTRLLISWLHCAWKLRHVHINQTTPE